ncbi:MAG: DUF1501 domain-containing protein [Pirellulaceae bacterium]
MPQNSPFHRPSAPRRHTTRREFLAQSGGGLGAIALAAMLGEETAANTPHKSHFAPKAKRVVQLFMAGGASHLDLWDYKPELVKRNGQESDFGEPVEAFQNGLGPWKEPTWKFRPYGESGKPLSEVVSPLGGCVDDIAFIHNMVGKTGVHSQGTLLQTTGFNLPGFPGMGSWVSYGLGSENKDLPTFVVLPDHRGFASNGAKNWDAAFLASDHTGTVIFPDRANPINDLMPHASGDYITQESEAETQAMLAQLNQRHAADRMLDGRLESRIRSYELAARMQLAAPEALEITNEPKYIRDLYGIAPDGTEWPSEINPREEADAFGRKCLIARRLLERDVRFVQIWSGNDNGFPRRNWDSHEDVERDHGPLAQGMAQGAAGLIQDLKQRGMLEDTIILWTTEFGRMPSTQGGKGRDHNPYTFTNWLCGGGIRGGMTHGESDELGYKPLDRANPTQVYDIHATILHLLGLDHTRLTVRHNGIDRRLTDVHGHVLHDILA